VRFRQIDQLGQRIGSIWLDSQGLVMKTLRVADDLPFVG
jgi:hypothetical protein